MRLATILEDGRPRAAVVRGDRVLPVEARDPAFTSVRGLAAGGAAALEWVRAWLDGQPTEAGVRLGAAELGPAVPDPGAIFAIGLNYAATAAAPDAAVPDAAVVTAAVLAGHALPADAPPARPLVYAKLPTSVSGHGATLAWDRSLTANVDAEVELGVVIGLEARDVPPERAMAHVLGYTCIDDISSRDPWLDGDQWLLGKSMAGFCPVGPWIVTADELDPSGLRLGCSINGVSIQDGTTAAMRSSIPAVISYLSHHVVLRPGDLIATGTPARLTGPLGPQRHLQPGDDVAVWVEGIGTLTTRIE